MEPRGDRIRMYGTYVSSAGAPSLHTLRGNARKSASLNAGCDVGTSPRRKQKCLGKGYQQTAGAYKTNSTYFISKVTEEEQITFRNFHVRNSKPWNLELESIDK
jgi:hypothetical protein